MSFAKQALDQNNFAYNAKFHLFIHLQNSKHQDLALATSQFVAIDERFVYHRQEYNMYVREYTFVFPQLEHSCIPVMCPASEVLVHWGLWLTAMWSPV